MILLLGDSHTGALKQGYDALAAHEKILPYARFGRVRIAMLTRGSQFRKTFFKLYPDRLCLTGPGGKRLAELAHTKAGYIEYADRRFFCFSIGFHLLSLVASPMWKQFTIDPLNVDKHYISQAALRQIVRAFNDPILSFFSGLLQLKARIIVLGAPPPTRAWSARHFDGLSEGEFLHLVSSLKRVFADELTSMGVRYIDPPALVAENGFLRKELCRTQDRRDFHGNAIYGEIFLRHIFSLLRYDYFTPAESPFWRRALSVAVHSFDPVRMKRGLKLWSG